MRRSLVVMTALPAAAGLVLGFAALRGGGGPDPTAAADPVPAGSAVSAVAQGNDELEIRASSRKTAGEYRLRSGRTIRIDTADTDDGYGCLLDVENGRSLGSSCFEGGLFAAQKLAFAMHFDGGPHRFEAARVAGVAAPGVVSVTLEKTDGSTVALQLTRGRAFLYESSSDELALDVLPSAVEALGPRGRLLDRMEIPRPR